MPTLQQPSSSDVTCVSAIQVAKRDSVAVALHELARGARIEVDGREVVVVEKIPANHKFSVVSIEAGASVYRFGEVIGSAKEAIELGAHVHTHNLKTELSSTLAYTYQPVDPSPEAVPAKGISTFLGYRRSDGRVGTRNEIWVVATVGCVARVCEDIARRANDAFAGRVDGVKALTHPHGCSQLGDDLQGTRDVLAALARHPNAGGVVIVGLGCESNQSDQLIEAIGRVDMDRVRVVTAQACDDEIEAGLTAIEELVDIVESDEREACSISELVLGLKCGGSDSLSGLTANPLLGDMTDRVVAHRGSAVLTEIPEVFGAETQLMARAKTQATFDNIVEVVNGFKQYFIDQNQPVYENPSPGNKAGGITTLEEKSLGAVQKSGRVPVVDVVRYGQSIKRRGLTLLEAPGNDAVSSTALAAAGATLILFTTGRGTPLGFPVPTVKVASNSELAARKSHWIDFDAGKVLAETDREPVADEFWDYLIETASGKQTRNEVNGEAAIAIWKRGVTL